MTKTNPSLHLNTEGYAPWEVEAIRNNHLVLVLSSYNNLEKTKLSEAREYAVTEPFDVSHFTADTDDKSTDTLASIKKSFARIPANVSLNLDSVDKTKPKFPVNAPVPETFTDIKIAPHVSVCGLSWQNESKITCIWSSSLLAFKALLTEDVMNLAHEIMRSDRPVFTNEIDPFVLKSLADATLNTQTAFFPGSDPMLRAFRGHNKLPPVITHWKKDLSVDNAPARMSSD